MNLGDKVTHINHGEEIGVVNQIWADGSFNVMFEDGEYSLPSTEFTLIQSKLTKLLPRVIDESLESKPLDNPEIKFGHRLRSKLSEPLPEEVKQAFINHCQAWYKNRFLWAVKADDVARDFLRDNSIDIPENARPVKSDMRSCSGCFTIRKPFDMSILPPLRWISRGENIECNDVRLVIAMAKLGFSINSYTREGE